MSILLLCTVSNSGCSYYDYQITNLIRDETAITIPKDAHIIYHLSGDYLVGRRQDYTTFKFDDEPRDFIDLFHPEDEVFEEHFQSDLILNFSDKNHKLKIPTKYLPDLTQEYVYIWMVDIGAYFVYQTESQMLVVFLVAI